MVILHVDMDWESLYLPPAKTVSRPNSPATLYQTGSAQNKRPNFSRRRFREAFWGQSAEEQPIIEYLADILAVPGAAL